MPKSQLSEEKMVSLILEGTVEALEEMSADEGLGRFLGSATQWARNKLNNFKADFKAGQNAQRWYNRDYDPYAKYGNDGENMRNFNGPEYGAYRYNKTVERNANAPHYTRERIGRQSQTSSQEGSQQQSQAPQRQKTAPQGTIPRQRTQSQAQQRTQQAANQGQIPMLNGIGPNPDLIAQNDPNIVQRANNMTDMMSAYGLKPVYAKQDMINGQVKQGATPISWKSSDGKKLTQQQRMAIQQWAKYKLREQKEELKKLLAEQRRK